MQFCQMKMMVYFILFTIKYYLFILLKNKIMFKQCCKILQFEDIFIYKLAKIFKNYSNSVKSYILYCI